MTIPTKTSQAALIAIADAAIASSHRGRRQLETVLEAARCPVAERILENNKPEPYRYGMAGLEQVILDTTDARTLKRHIAKSIIAMRRARAVLKLQGKGIAAQHRAADYYLNRIAFIRSHLTDGEER